MREATTTTTQTTTSNALKGGGFDADGFDEEDNKKNASFFRSYKSLLSRWPARKKHIDFLLAALGGGFGRDAKRVSRRTSTSTARRRLGKRCY